MVATAPAAAVAGKQESIPLTETVGRAAERPRSTDLHVHPPGRSRGARTATGLPARIHAAEERAAAAPLDPAQTGAPPTAARPSWRGGGGADSDDVPLPRHMR